MVLGGQALPAQAANGSLVVAALQALEQNYVDSVHPVPLLNAAIASMRQATGENAALLPDIPSVDTEAQADAAFLAEFSSAAGAAGVSETQLAYTATAGMLESLHDSHTYFLRPAQIAQVRQELMGQPGFTGVGIMITSRADDSGARWIFVEDVFPESPASSAGIQRFDRILQVGDTSLRNATTREASLAIRGPEGSTAVLTIQRAGQMLTIPVVRSAIRAPRVEARFIQPGVAYARVFEFSRGSGRALGAALGELAAQAPLRSIVLDLRGNPGGLITEAGRIGSLFLPTGTPLARVHDRDNGPSVLRAAGPAPFADIPLAILVDGGSASASEIIAGAFRDAHRGTIIGEKTAGALGGAIDIALPEGGMSVTVERITTPLGEQVEGTGIVPDHPVALTVADMERGQDVQLDAALRTLGAVETFHL
jgi:carboxyl-terminal processing protease